MRGVYDDIKRRLMYFDVDLYYHDSIKKNSVETKNLIKKVCVSEDNTFEGCFNGLKKTLIKNLEQEEVHKNLILFKVVHTNQFPLKETLIPIAKRKVMNYINQSKFIEVKNLTKKI